MSTVVGFSVGAAVLGVLALVRAAAAAPSSTRAMPAHRLRHLRWLRPPARLAPALERAAVDVPAETAWSAWLATAVAAASAGAVLGGPALALVATVLAGGAPAWLLRAASGRSDQRMEDALPDTVEATARALRSGASLRGGLAEAAEQAPPGLRADLLQVVVGAERGLPLADALDRWAEVRPLPGVRLAVAAMTLTAEAGGAAARALDGVAATLRDRAAVGREVRALSAQARLSALIIALAPLGFGAVAVGLDGASAAFLTRTPLGLACLVLGIALDAAAAGWMVRITRSVR